MYHDLLQSSLDDTLIKSHLKYDICPYVLPITKRSLGAESWLLLLLLLQRAETNNGKR
jgi:hypothetical protein